MIVMNFSCNNSEPQELVFFGEKESPRTIVFNRKESNPIVLSVTGDLNLGVSEG